MVELEFETVQINWIVKLSVGIDRWLHRMTNAKSADLALYFSSWIVSTNQRQLKIKTTNNH